MSFDYQGAKQAGYSDEEIMSHLSENNPKFDIQGASQAGYSPEEINQHLIGLKPEQKKQKEKQPEHSFPEKAARLGGQFAMGAAESALLPYELAVAPLASKDAQNMSYRETLSDDLERLQEQKAMGQWDQKDQELYDSIVAQIKDPEKSKEFAKTANLGIRDLTEQATGLDLKPEGVLEKAASWAGFIKDPKKLVSLAKTGGTLPQAMKAIAPTGTEMLRGVGAGAALQLAENGEYGPIGTMASAVIGDLIGGGVAKGAKAVGKLVMEPKKTIAEAVTSFMPKEKLDLQKEIIKDFRDAGIQADLGTITDSNIIKWTQSRLAQSGLTGKALDDFKKELTDQIKREYNTLANTLGELKTTSLHEAGEIGREGIRKIRDSDLAATRELYKKANESLKENSFVNPANILSSINRLETQLKPGQIKSGEQNSVLNVLENLKRDVSDSTGRPMFAKVKDLMNNKIALNDIINYEVQGGAKQLLKGIVADLDRAIISHSKDNASFGKNYIMANKKFSEHAKTFRNKNVDQILRASDPAQLMNKMGSVQGIRDFGKILNRTAEGKDIFNQLKRLKLEKAIGDNLVDSTTKQVKLGTFSKLLDKANNRDSIKEILGPKAFKQLERLQKNAGKLADAADKFYNTSKSGAVAADAAVIATALHDISNLLAGNPWPLVRTGSTVLAVRGLSNLIANPEFLKLAEEAILASERESKDQLIEIIMRMKPMIMQVLPEKSKDTQTQPPLAA